MSISLSARSADSLDETEAAWIQDRVGKILTEYGYMVCASAREHKAGDDIGRIENQSGRVVVFEHGYIICETTFEEYAKQCAFLGKSTDIERYRGRRFYRVHLD